MNYFTVPEMMNFGSDLIDAVFPAYTAEKSSVIPSFDTENTPIKDSRSQTRDLTFCDTRVNVPSNVITDTVVAELDSICNLTDLVDSPIVSAYLKVLSHAYWFYSKWIDYRLTDEMKRSYIQETIETVTAGLREGSNLLVNIPTRGQRTRPVFIISKRFFAHHMKCYHEQIRPSLTNISQNHYCLYMFSLPYAPNTRLIENDTITVELVKKIAFINGCGWLIRSKQNTSSAFSYRADSTIVHANPTPEFKAIISMTGRTLKPHRAIAYMYKPINDDVVNTFARDPENVDVSASADIEFSETNYLAGNYSLDNINDYIINVK